MNTKKKKKTLLNTLMKNSRKMLKTELAIVYVTTSNKKFLREKEAIREEIKQEEIRQVERNERDRIMKINELILKVLRDNDCGIFFKGEPIQMLPVQDGITMYKVNEVESDRLFDAIDAQLNEMENKCQTDKNDIEEGQIGN
jgi:hypothetical protein